MKAVVHLLPTPLDMQAAMGQSLSQAFGQFAQAAGSGPGRIPVDMLEGARTLEFVGAVRSESDQSIVRLFDDKDRELGVVPVHRVNYIEFR